MQVQILSLLSSTWLMLKTAPTQTKPGNLYRSIQYRCYEKIGIVGSKHPASKERLGVGKLFFRYQIFAHEMYFRGQYFRKTSSIESRDKIVFHIATIVRLVKSRIEHVHHCF